METSIVGGIVAEKRWKKDIADAFRTVTVAGRTAGERRRFRKDFGQRRPKQDMQAEKEDVLVCHTGVSQDDHNSL